MELPNPSNEQKEVINNLKKYNLIVDSVAGSGKTTTNLHIATKYKKDNILLLTYNAKLKLETRKKVNQLGLTNLEVHSYHSFCVKYYKRDCFTDSGMIKLLKEDASKLSDFSYDIIILDEAQDITPLYYKLICKLFFDNKSKKSCKICILGDRYQSIYGFNNADERFIIFAHKIFRFNHLPWKSLKLSTSFRVTFSISEFINKALIKKNRIDATKIGEKVRYIICDTFGDKLGSSKRSFREIDYYLQRGYSHEDIFVLAPSVKSEKSPVRQLSNYLSDVKKIPIFVPVSDEEKLDQDILKGKIVFSTFHQVKGLERKVVIIYNFDDSYFKFYKKNHNPTICSNELYVATTRALEHMTVFHHNQNDYLPFINQTQLKHVCYFENNGLNVHNKDSNKNLKTAITDLTKHLPVTLIEELYTYFDVNQIQEKGKKININCKSKQDSLYENVSEITGIAIPSYFEYKKTGKMTIFPENNKIEEENNKKEHDFIEDSDEDKSNEDSEDSEDKKNTNQFKNIKLKTLTCQQLLYISNKWCSKKTGYNYKLNQIKKYDWLSKDNLKLCYERFNKYISNNSEFEKEYNLENEFELYNRKLIGCCDCIDNKNNILWEFKCVSKLESEHYIQLALYMYCFLKKEAMNQNFRIFDVSTGIMINKEDRSDKMKFYLFNILNNEIYEIKSDIHKLINMVKKIIEYKYFNTKTKTDKEFITFTNKIYNKYYVKLK